MVVSVEQAASSDLDTAATVVFSELTGASPGRARVTSGRLGGHSARHLSTDLSAGGATQHAEAYVMVDGHRAWEVAVEAPEQSAAADSAPFQQMAGTFRLVGAQPTPPARASVGLPAPPFSELDRIKGPVIINFFASWCTDCRADMPQIARAAMGNQGRVTLLGVDCCSDRSSDVPTFLRQLGVQNAFHDVTYDNDRRIAASYGLLGPPTTAFLDKDHVLRGLVAGPVTSASLKQGLREAGVS